jgi:protease-4
MRQSIHRGLALSLVLTGAAAAVDASAGEPLPARAQRVFTPGRNAASDDSSDAVVVNPANLATMPSWEGRATYVHCSDDTAVNGCGWSFALATPLFWGFSTALRFDLVQPQWGAEPTVGAQAPFRGNDYTWLTWGLGLRLAEGLAVGASVQRSYSQNFFLDGLVGLSAGVTLRPNNVLGLAVVAHDYNGASSFISVLDRSFVFAGALRPTGTRAFELGVEAKYLSGTDQWLPRATLGIDVPGVGRLRGDVEMAHFVNDARRGVTASAGIEIAYDTITAGGGAIFGNGLGTATSLAEYGTISFGGARQPGVPRAQRAVFLRLEKTPGNRGHVHLLQKLWRLAEDREVAAVTLVLRAEPASSYAHAEELADALRVLRARGKKTMCSFEDNGAKSLYVCANADKIVVNPAGGLRYAGHASSFMYFKGLLDKLGVRADFVRVGAHKSAPEQFMNEQGSDAARADHEDALRNIEAVFVKNLAQGRRLQEDKVRAATRTGPFVASEARDAGFVDGYAYDDELERVTQDLVGANVRYEKYADQELAPKAFGPQGKVGVLYIDGDIIDGRSMTIPLVDTKLVGSYTIVDAIKQLKDDPTVRSVVLRIESPGGSSMASDVMWRELVLLGEKKPLIVSMGSVAASGGYYVASAGKTIFALPLTVTGSIGVFYGKADVAELLKKLGVNIETYRTAPRADAESIYRPFTPEERVELQRKVGQFYDVFLDRVASGRHITKDEVDAVGQGRVWLGQQAVQRKLVDRMGGIRHALEAAREAGGLPADAPILEMPRIEPSLLERAIGLAGASPQQSLASALPAQVRTIAKALAPLVAYQRDIALARLDWTSLDEEATDEP